MTEKPDYYSHRKRLRSRFNKSGLESLSDYEQLELLLTYAVPRKDIKPIGKELIKKFGKISIVLDSDPKLLSKIKNLGPESVTLIKLVKELISKYLEEKMYETNFKISSPDSVANFARSKIGSSKNELFIAIYLNAKNKVVDYKIFAEGSVDSVAIYPRRIIELALEKKASGVILVHNHPSGDLEPSKSDIEITNEIKQIGSLLDIRILDHLIVNKSSYYSFLKNNLLENW